MKRYFISAFIIVVVVAAYGMFAQQASTTSQTIVPSEAQALLERDSTVVVLDVRTPGEYSSSTGHLAHAILIPVQELESRVNELAQYKSKKILVYCRTGHRSTNGTQILSSKGFNAMNMLGGITRWNAENRPVVKETQE